MSDKVTLGIIIFGMINLCFCSSRGLAQNVLIFPDTPVVDINHELTFMCKSSAHKEEWRSTLFYDETANDGLSSVGLFHKNADGLCTQSVVSTKYQASCDIAKGEFNLTIGKIDRQYHDKMISCTTQFGNGSFEDMSVTKTAKIYVKVPISDINLSKTEIETDVSSKYTIRCSVVSRPAATITWIKFNADGLQDDITSFSQVSTSLSIAGETISSVLTINFSKLDNNGHLKCKANNSFSVRQSQDIPLNIYYPPENRPVIRQVKPGPVDSGDTVYLHCSVYGGYPIAKLIWDCQGKIIDQSSDTLSAVILELVVDRRYDDRICSCAATHPDRSYQHTIQHKLIVYYSPSLPKLSTIPEKPWFVGNTTNVLCLSEEGKPKSEFQWFINGQLKKENYSVLAIGPLTKNDNKIEIFCKAMNAYTERHEIMLTSEPLHIDVEYYPEVIFDNNVDTVYAIEGENLTVKCRAYGNPNPMVHWEASNIELTVREDSQSVLYLYRIERHQQLLTCHAVSLSKKYGQLVTAKPIGIEVFYQPKITKIEVQDKTHFTEGQTASLHCQVDSYPLSNISWVYIYNNTLLSETNNVSESFFDISSARCLDTGIYQCKAMTNIQGKLYSTTAQININVICGPRTDYSYPSLPKKMAVAFNDSLDLTVHLVAFPSPLINWYLLDTKLNSLTHVLGSSVTTNVFVPDVKKANLGKYTINAINSAGSHVININVVAKGKPEIPFNLNLFCGSTTANIVWTVPFDGGDKQKFQVHIWADDNGTEINKSKYIDDPGEGKSLKFETKVLREKTVYYFQIVASNSIGNSTAIVQCNTTGTSKQLPMTESSQTTTPTVSIVAGVGFCVLLIIIITIIVYYCRKNKCSEKTKLSRPSSSQISYINMPTMSNNDDFERSITSTDDQPFNSNRETIQSGRYENTSASGQLEESQTQLKSIDDASRSATNDFQEDVSKDEDNTETKPKSIDDASSSFANDAQEDVLLDDEYTDTRPTAMSTVFRRVANDSKEDLSKDEDNTYIIMNKIEKGNGKYLKTEFDTYDSFKLNFGSKQSNA